MATTIVSRTQSGSESAAGRRTFTFSAWIKRTGLGSCELFGSDSNGARGNNYFIIDFNGSNNLDISEYISGSQLRLITNRQFRDTSAWYHLVLAFDTTQGTSSNRIKVYINGVQETSFSTATYPSQDYQTKMFAQNKIHAFGRSGAQFDGLISHCHATEGTAYTPSAFGETDSTTGEWKIKTDVSVSYGTNGFFLFKDDNAVTNQAGNSSGNFAVGAGTLTKTEDNPSNVFATINPLSTPSTLSNGNLKSVYAGSGSYATASSTLGMTSGKYYCEVKLTTASNYPSTGICATNSSHATTLLQTNWLGKDADNYGIYTDSGVVYNNGSIVNTFGSISTNDILGMALDLDSAQNTLKYYKNGSLIGTQNITTNSNGWLFAITTNSIGTNFGEFNFGNGYFGTTAVSSAGTNASNNGIFEYDVPTGYTALSTKGLNL